jgi:hypothetical protein
MNLMKFLTRALLSLSMLLVFSPEKVLGQSLIFDKSAIEVSPGETFTLGVSLDTGLHDINLWLLYVYTTGSVELLSITSATLGLEWEYFGDPEWPIAVPAEPANSGELGLAFPIGPEPLPPGTWQLTTLTLRLSETASFGSFQFMTTPDSAFFDGVDNALYPTAAVLNVNVVPEPSASVLLSAAACLNLLFGPRSRAARLARSIPG